MGSTPKGVPRPFLDSARWQHETGPWGTQPPHHQTGNADTEPGAPLSRPPQTARHAEAIKHAHLTNDTTYQLYICRRACLRAGRIVGVSSKEIVVDVQRRADVGVAEDVADLDDVERALDDQVASERMAQVVEAQPR
jgi:hypothetical protein